MRHHNLQVTGSVVVNGLGLATTADLTSYTASADAKISTLQSFTASVGTTNTFTASAILRLNDLETKSASVDTTNTTQNNRLTSLEEKTGSLATTGSNIFYGQQVFSGSLYVQDNLIVQGSSSLQNITASAVSIGTNIVYLNTDTPAVRFAGLTVQDSGSSAGVTGSMLWDSLCNRWIYSNPSTIGYSGGMLLSGPRTQTLGTEPTLTCNYIAKSGGGDHLYDSCIFDNGSTVGINTTTPLADSTFESLGYNLFRENATSAHSWFPYTDGSVYISARTGSSIIFREYNDNCIKVAMTITGSNVSIGRTDTMYRLNIAHDVPKTCTTARGLAFFGSNDVLASAPFGLVITSQGGATLGDRIVRMGTTDFGLANGGTLELNGALFICNSGNVGIRHGSPENALHVCINSASTGVTIAQFENKDFTSGTRSYARVRGWVNAGASYSSYFGQGQDGKTYIYANNTARCGDIVIDGSTGYVGVGTNVPTLQMHIHSATNDYNTIFSTSCVCGRAGFVIARPGSTSAIASALVLASDCSYRLGGGSYYNIKMLQDGSTTILNTSEGDALKVAPGGAVSINTGTSTIDASNQRLQVYGAIRQDVLGVSYGEGMIMNFPANGTNYGGLFFHSTATPLATVGASSIKWGINYNYTPEDGVGAGNLAFVNANTTTMMNITSGGCVYIGKGWGATNHRINLQKPQGCTILVVSGYSSSSNDSVIISAASGAGYNGALTVMGVTTNSSTGRSISAGGSITGGGNDYAEYIVKRNDAGCIQKGQIAGIDSCKLLTDKWSLACSFVVKSTDPSFVGGDSWDKHIGNRPQQTTCITDEEFAPILAEYENNLEEARNKVDRIAFSGQVPVIVSGSYNVGDYILPIEGPDDTIVGVACSLSSLTLDDYGKTVGRVWGTCLDKAWVAVKIG
jgi:hypothetical protein